METDHAVSLPSVSTRRIGVGLVGSLALLVGLLAFVNWEAVLVRLSRANPAALAAAVLSVPVIHAIRSEGQRRLIASAGTPIPPGQFLFLHYVAAFFRLLLPFGQATGPAVLAFVVRADVGGSYERHLAGATVATFMGSVSSLMLTALGVVAVFGVVDPTAARTFGSVVAVALTSVVSLALIVRFRPSDIEGATVRVAAPIRRVFGRYSERLNVALSPESVRSSVGRFERSLVSIAGDGRTLVVAFGLHFLAALLAVFPLYACFLAVGYPISPELALLLVPGSGLVTILPFPGGLGEIEIALTALVVKLGGVPLATAAAGVLLYRVSVFWLTLTVAGLTAVTFFSARDT